MAEVSSEAQNLVARVLRRELLEERERLVFGAVVDEEDLGLDAERPEERLQPVVQDRDDLFLVVDREDEGQGRARHERGYATGIPEPGPALYFPWRLRKSMKLSMIASPTM